MIYLKALTIPVSVSDIAHAKPKQLKYVERLVR